MSTALAFRDRADAGASRASTESRAAALARGSGPLRRALAALAGRFVALRGWERLGFVRLGDYAAERLGMSARELQDLARTDAALAPLPQIEAALAAGELGWTKARLLARAAKPENQDRWLAFARQVTAGELARSVRAVDRGALEAGAAGTPAGDEPGEERSEGVAIHCTPDVVVKWSLAWRVAQRVAGAALPRWACMEAVVAEVASAFPVELDLGCDPETNPPRGQPCPDELDERWFRRHQQRRAQRERSTLAATPLPAPADALLRELESADAFELDARLRRAVGLEQRREALLGEALLEVATDRLYRLRGYRSFEAYVRDRLGMAPSKAWGLLRLERAAQRSPLLRVAYREGRLSWLQAQALATLVGLSPAHEAAWVGWAQRVTLRRLREDVDRALEMAQVDAGAFEASGGLPPEGERVRLQIGASDTDSERPPPADREGETTRFFFRAPVDVARLFRAVVCTVRRRLAAQLGRLPSEGEACDAIFEHVFDAWGVRERVRQTRRVFARDGWRCTAPGCSSMRNLQDHHIVFRAHGGSHELWNRTTLCAWHHLRGVHKGIVRCRGRAPDALRFELGVRPGMPPLAVYHSGDVSSSTRHRYQEATLR